MKHYYNPRKVTYEYKDESTEYGRKYVYYEAEVLSKETEGKLNIFRIARKHKKKFLKYFPRKIETIWVTVPREIYNHYEKHNKKNRGLV